MTDQRKNLWGTLPDIKELKPPHEIINEQSRFLEEMTAGLVSLSVEKQQSKSVIFRYEIHLVAPSLNYRELVFNLTHDHKLYPATINDERESLDYKADNVAEFEQNLGKILSSKEIMASVGTLLARKQVAV